VALPMFAVLGVLAGLLGVAFNRSLLWALRRFAKLKRISPWLGSALVGGVAGALLWVIPAAVGGGHATAEALLTGRYAALHFLGFLAILLVVKFVLTVISYASGVPGGIFAPLLVLGATLGLMTGQVGSLALPTLAQTPAVFAVVGMAAAFSAIVRAPLTGIVLILEMTNNYQQLFALLVACMIAFLVAERLRNAPIYEALLEYDLEKSGPQENPEAQQPVTMDLVVEPLSRMDGRRVSDLGLPSECLMVLIVRGGRDIFPSEHTRLQAGDRVTFFVKGDSPESCTLLSGAARSE